MTVAETSRPVPDAAAAAPTGETAAGRRRSGSSPAGGVAGPRRLGGLLALLLAGCARPTLPAPLRVAAASDLTDAFTELGRRFEADTGRRVDFTFGSSGLLARQLDEGAPFDAFASASAAWAARASLHGSCVAGSARPYALGRLAVVAAPTGLAPPRALAELTDARFARIALANPEHAPYGLAARQALEAAGLWRALEPRLVLSESVRQALQFAQSGNADAAFVALSTVKPDDRPAVLLVDPSSHAPLEQVVVLCLRGPDPEGGRRFVETLFTPAGRAVLEAAAFVIPPLKQAPP